MLASFRLNDDEDEDNISDHGGNCVHGSKDAKHSYTSHTAHKSLRLARFARNTLGLTGSHGFYEDQQSIILDRYAR